MEKINKKTSYTIKELKDMGFAFDLNGNLLTSEEEECLNRYIKYREEKLIEKACEWLLKQKEMIGVSFHEDFIERFKEEMEE